jgi:dynein heavy chain
LELLDNPKAFLEQLKGYDKEHINQALVAKFNQKIMKDPDFTYEKAKAVGGPIEALYLWEMAMYSFNKIFLDTQPLREK